ncbi:WD40 repeat domain-containing protein [Streptomyces sp. HD]|uniref:WD40 repeat domain-containing protein n=1 Tax=Streptomyces sp. HD TaxID=3020892 RepID=UPI003FA7E6E1
MAPDGSWLATAGNGKSVRIWDHGFALTSSRTPGGHTGPVKEVAIALDSSWLATTSDDRKVRIWDRTSGICTAVLTGHTGSVNAVGIAPDGSWLATTSSVRRYLMAALERCRGPRHRLSGAVWHQRRRKDGAYVV